MIDAYFNLSFQEGETSFRNTSATLPETEETPAISQKRKRGRPKGWKKSTAEKSKQPETACVDETPSKKVSGHVFNYFRKLRPVYCLSTFKDKHSLSRDGLETR